MSHFNPALVVEDNAFVAMVAREVFEAHGCDSVTVIASLEFALNFVRSAQISFALLVTRLEEGDTSPLVTLLAGRNIPFAFVSDFADGRDIPEQWSGRPYISKPYSDAELGELLMHFAPGARTASG
jgi:CheY-like chemotaxis protein